MSDLLPFFAPYAGWVAIALAGATGLFLAQRKGAVWSRILGVLLACALPATAITLRTAQHGPGYWLRYGPGYWLSPLVLVRTEIHGPFTVYFYQDRREWEMRQQVRISPGQYRIDGTAGIYAWEVSQPEGSTDRRSGQDLTGDGRPDLILSAHVGGASQRFHLYSLSSQGQVVLVEAHRTPSMDFAYRAVNDQTPLRLTDSEGRAP